MTVVNASMQMQYMIEALFKAEKCNGKEQKLRIVKNEIEKSRDDECLVHSLQSSTE